MDTKFRHTESLLTKSRKFCYMIGAIGVTTHAAASGYCAVLLPSSTQWG